MTPIDVLALIFGIGVIAKLIVAVVNPEPWLKLAERLLKHKTFTTILYLVLIVIVGIYVFAGVTIEQVAAVIVLASLLLGLCLVPYARTALKLGKVMVGKDMIKKDWLALALWLALAVWAIYSVFV